MLLEHDEMEWRADRRGRRIYDEKRVFPPNIADHQREKAMRALSLNNLTLMPQHAGVHNACPSLFTYLRSISGAGTNITCLEGSVPRCPPFLAA